jgi:hypothetical protein
MGEKHKVLPHHQHPNISMPSERKLLPENYATCVWFMKFAYIYILGLSGVGKCLIHPSLSHDLMFCFTILQPHARAHIQSLICFDYLRCLLFYGCVENLLKGVEEITKLKQKHKWSGQLLNKIIENPYESYLGTGAKPTRDVSGTDFMVAYNPNKGI